MSTGSTPTRGEVWLTELGQTRGREQAARARRSSYPSMASTRAAPNSSSWCRSGVVGGRGHWGKTTAGPGGLAKGGFGQVARRYLAKPPSRATPCLFKPCAAKIGAGGGFGQVARYLAKPPSYR